MYFPSIRLELISELALLCNINSLVLFAYQSRLLTTCEMSAVVEAEVRVQGSQSSERGGNVNFALFLTVLTVSVCLFKFISLWQKSNIVLWVFSSNNKLPSCFSWMTIKITHVGCVRIIDVFIYLFCHFFCRLERYLLIFLCQLSKREVSCSQFTNLHCKKNKKWAAGKREKK